MNRSESKEWIDNFLRARERTHEGVVKVFRRWQTEKGKTFKDWFKEASHASGSALLEIYWNYLKRYSAILSGHIIPTINDVDLFPPPPVIIIHDIREIFKKHGVTDSDMWSKIIEYLQSDSLEKVPFNKISSMMYAAFARESAAGRKRPPNIGFVTDIDVISVLLPYCDVMFIDNECHNYLREKPLCDEINYGTKIFSLNYKDNFLKYLEEIKSTVSKGHIEKVKEVYGENWTKPFKTLYYDEK